MATRKPNFFIVGAPRCGTTSMFEYLRVHPDVYMPRHVKEVFYFGSDFTGPIFDRYRRDERAYLSLFEAARDETCLGEASVVYLQSRRAAGEIHAFNPDARIIAMFRDPVAVLHSYHQRLLYSGCEDIESFEEALEAEPDRRAGRRIPPTNYVMTEGLFYSDVVKFASQLQRYFDVFGRDAVHTIIHDDLVGDVADTYRRTLEFLAVDPVFTPDFNVANSNMRSRSKLLMSLMANRRLVAVGDRVQFIAMPVFRLLRRLNTKRFTREPIDARIRQRIQEEVRPEVERLSEMLGRDLTPWCTPGTAAP